jgi:hypothetical protein
MKSYCKSLTLVISKLKCFWLFILFAGLIVAILGATACRDSWAETLLIYGGGALIGFASSAFFSRQEQFLLRGVKDRVYLVKNHSYYPRIYELADRKTFAAIGGIWHEIQNIPEGLVEHLHRWFGKGELSLTEAKLYKLSNEESVFAVLLDVRYGVPNLETRKSIWGDQPTIHTVDISELDKWLPGSDLVSIHYWPEKDRGHI